MKKQILLVLVLSLFTSPCYGGLFANLMNAIHKSVEDYNTDYLATGDAVTVALKEGKLNAAFTAYEQNMMVTCDHALANTKVIYKSLMDIVNWLPNKIKELWEKFVAGLASIRETFGQSGPSRPKASLIGAFDFSLLQPEQMVSREPSRRVSRGLGDNFLQKFQGAQNLSEKFSTFVKYQGHITMWQSWLSSLGNKEQSSLMNKFNLVRSERDEVEQLMFDEVTESLQSDGKALVALTTALESVDRKDGQLLYESLAIKVKRHVNSLSLHGRDRIVLKEQVTRFRQACQDLGF